MDEFLQIQLGKAKNAKGVNVDENINLSLKSSVKEILSYNESSSINVSDLFNSERQESESYRVYGSIDYIGITNGLSVNYSKLSDFFTPPRLGAELSGGTKNILNSFDVYLCYPATGNTPISAETFIRNYVVATKLENCDIFKAGYARNLYFNFKYCYEFNVDFDLEGLVDSFGKPYNELYLYFNFKPTGETVYSYDYISGSHTTPLPYVKHNVGDMISGDLVNYVNRNFEEDLILKMEYYVDFPYDVGSLQFKYQPFVPIKIRDFGDEIVMGNITGGTEIDLNIPLYAVSADTKGTRIWKNILQNGYIDPISGKGVNFPFVNKRHYVFNNIILSFKPEVSIDPNTLLPYNSNTFNVFNDILFNTNTGVYVRPSSDLKKLGNKCT